MNTKMTKEEMERRLDELNVAIKAGYMPDPEQSGGMSYELMRAELLIELGDYKKAVSDLGKYRYGKPGENVAFDACIMRCYNKIIENNRHNIDVLELVTREIGNSEVAERAWELALGADPENINLLKGLASACEDHEKKREVYSKILALAPGHVEILVKRAGINLELEQWADAVTDLEHALAMNTDPEKATGLQYSLGIAYFYTEAYQKAAGEFARARDGLRDDKHNGSRVGFNAVKKYDISDVWPTCAEKLVNLWLGTARLCLGDLSGFNELYFTNHDAASAMDAFSENSKLTDYMDEIMALTEGYGFAVSASKRNRLVLDAYRAFTDKLLLMPDQIMAYIPVLVCAYNNGHYEKVIEAVDRCGNEFTAKPQNPDEWPVSGYTPISLAIKGFALGELGRMDEANAAVIKAMNYYAEPTSYQLFDVNYPYSLSKLLFFNTLDSWHKFSGLELFVGNTHASLLLQGIMFSLDDQKREQALKVCATAEKKYGKHYISSRAKAVCLYYLNKYDEAIIASSEIIDLCPPESDSYYYGFFLRGLVYYAMGECDAAVKDLTSAIERKPNLVNAHLYRGRAYMKIGRTMDACNDYDKVRTLDPSQEIEMSYEVLAEQIARQERIVAEARVEERNKVIQDMSHSIKNLVASVVEPLNDLAVKYTDDRVVIQKALRGAELIRGTVNALNLSFKGSPEDFVADAKGAATSDHAVSLEYLLIVSLESAVSNMFDGKYFADFCHAYFPSRKDFFEAKKVWDQVQKSVKKDELIDFLSEFMFDLNIEDEIGLNTLFLDDAHNSPLKITILFQELLLNAVKYACFSPREDRFVGLSVKKKEKNIVLCIENAFVPGKSARTTRVGNEIVKNIATLMGGTVENRPCEEGGIYEAVLTIPNIFNGAE